MGAAVIGHNNPPTPFDEVKEKISGLYEEAKNWLDGDPIANQAQADEVQKLLRLIQSAEKEADEARKLEAKPYDDAKAEIQSRYNMLIGNTKAVKGLTVLAIDACKKALAPWLMRVEEENRRKAEEARREAEAKAAEARAAMQARQTLEDAERAEELARAAKEAEAAARRASNEKASAKGAGRAVSLRTYYVAELVDENAFAKWVWQNQRNELSSFLSSLAQRLVDGKFRDLPGVEVREDRRAA